jgi:hypothetical protein
MPNFVSKKDHEKDRNKKQYKKIKKKLITERTKKKDTTKPYKDYTKK